MSTPRPWTWIAPRVQPQLEMTEPRPGSLCPSMERPSRELGGDLGHVDARAKQFPSPGVHASLSVTTPAQVILESLDLIGPPPLGQPRPQPPTPPGIPLTSPLSALYPLSAGTPPPSLLSPSQGQQRRVDRRRSWPS